MDNRHYPWKGTAYSFDESAGCYRPIRGYQNALKLLSPATWRAAVYEDTSGGGRQIDEESLSLATVDMHG
jgi:hypothetical protein